MTAIDPVGVPPAVRPAPRKAGGAGTGFTPLAEPAADAARPAGEVEPMMELQTLLALQQMDDAPARDIAAHRRGQSLLAALGRLQRALLGAGDASAVLDEIRSLARDVPVAADPALATAVAQVVLRAQIELARRGASDA
ncbi:MAG TPA: flagellar assembly protein FliX [Acetobacteraceae bacterium]|nr:flagellar assembly protein FliX [Acetobacteraceae bacterium]